MADKRTGLDCKLYVGTALLTSADASTQSGSWVESTIARDVTTGNEKAEADISSRGSTYRQRKTTLKDAPIEGELVYDTDDYTFQAMRDAYNNNTELAMAAMDRGITTVGAQGLAGNFEILSFVRNEPLEGGVTITFRAVPSAHTHWYTKGT